VDLPLASMGFGDDAGYLKLICRPLLSVVSQGLDFKEAIKLFEVNNRTLWRAQTEGSHFLEQFCAHPNTSRMKISPQRGSEAVDFINNKMPVISGRNYGLLNTTEDFFYQQYRRSCTNPVGTSFFIYKILPSFKYHHSTVPDICPYCAGTATRTRKGSGEALSLHKEQVNVQKCI